MMNSNTLDHRTNSDFTEGTWKLREDGVSPIVDDANNQAIEAYQKGKNEAVCCYLELKPDYGDWVITTAFYSALHWLHHHFRTGVDVEFCKIKLHTFSRAKPLSINV